MLTKTKWPVLVVVLVAGCSRAGITSPATYEVTGKVQYQGKPLPSGMVRFTSTGEGGASAGEITNGTFKLTSTAGAKRVEVVITPKTPPEKAVTDKYAGAESPLKAEVSALGSNKFEFDIPAK